MSNTPRDTLMAWDREFVWHPFTPHSIYAQEDPLMVVAAEGHTLIDADGRRLLDGVGSLWCNILGHRRAELDAAIIDQLGRVAHATFLGNATAPAVKLARRLVEIAPGDLSRVFYSDNGSTAVEIALKMAYQFWQQHDDGAQAQRKTFLTVGNGYHGDTVGAVSLGSVPLFHARYRSLLFDTLEAPSPYCLHCPLGLERQTCAIDCLTELERIAEAHGDELAAIVVEPLMQGAAGMIRQPKGWLRRVREVCDRVGCLLIDDEVAMGMGRTGHMFACEAEGVAPDLMCLAKGITNGYVPLAATLATERIFNAFLGDPELGRTFFHGHTFTGNPLGAAAALATLDYFRDNDLLAAVRDKADWLALELQKIAASPHVAEVRQAGMAVGIELRCPPGKRTGARVCLAARGHGVFLRPLGDVVILMPALTMNTIELNSLLCAVSYAIQEVFDGDKVCGGDGDGHGGR